MRSFHPCLTNKFAAHRLISSVLPIFNHYKKGEKMKRTTLGLVGLTIFVGMLTFDVTSNSYAVEGTSELSRPSLLSTIKARGRDAFMDNSQQSLQANAVKEQNVVPGEIIVKIKSDSNLSVDQLASNPKQMAATINNASPEMRAFSQKYKITGVNRIFKVGNQTNQGAMMRRMARRGNRINQARAIDLSQYVKIKLNSAAKMSEVLRDCGQVPAFDQCQANYIQKSVFTANDEYFGKSGAFGQPYSNLWGLDKIQAPLAWDLGDSGQGKDIVVAVIDSGVDSAHPDIAANIWKNASEVEKNGIDDDQNFHMDDTEGWNFIGNNNNTQDDFGHGTHIAGTIAAVANNGIGIIGVAPKSKIMSVKVLDANGSGTTDGVAAGIQYAVDNGADVINLSLGCDFCPSNPIEEDLVRYAHKEGVVVVFAAGNTNRNVGYRSPQNMTDSKPIVAAASTQQDKRAFFSDFGLTIDVAAPGGGTPGIIFDVLSLRSSTCNKDFICPDVLRVGTQYLRLAGTSMAAPHVAGAAAVILSRHPNSDFSVEDVAQAIKISADQVFNPQTDLLDVGRLNVAKAANVNSVLRASISSPKQSEIWNSASEAEFSIVGTASGPDFKSYQLFYSTVANLSNWLPIDQPVMTPVNNGVLGTLKSGLYPNGLIRIKLEASTFGGQKFTAQTQIVHTPSVTKMTDNAAQELQPAISGNRVVRVFFKGYNLVNKAQYDIVLYDLVTKTEKIIQLDALLEQNADLPHPVVIFGDNIAWIDSISNNRRVLHVFNSQTEHKRIALPNQAPVGSLSIAENYIVLEQFGYVYLYDLRQGTLKQLSGGDDFDINPTISHDKVAWIRIQGGYDLIHFDVTSGAAQTLLRGIDYLDVLPTLSMSENHIGWLDTKVQINLYEIGTTAPQVIVSAPAEPRDLKISGNTVLWADVRRGPAVILSNPFDPLRAVQVRFKDIYTYDLVSRQVRSIGFNSDVATINVPFYHDVNTVIFPSPDISGDKIVWADYRSGDGDIYVYKDSTVPDGLLASWKFNEANPNPAQAIDSLDKNPLSLTDTMFITPGYNNTNGGALQFNGSTAKAVSQTFTGPANKITIAAWFKQTSNDRQKVIVQGGAQGDFFYRLEVSEKKNSKNYLRGGVGDGGPGGTFGWDNNIIFREDEKCVVSPNTWHLGVLTHDNDSNQTALYLDGFPCFKATSSKDLAVAPGITIGAYTSPGFNFAGSLDEVRVYNKALSDKEVADLYGPGTPTKFPSKVVIQPPTPNPSKLNEKVVFPTILQSEDGTHMTGTVQFVDLSNGENSVPQCAALTLQPFPDNPAGTFDFVRCETTGLSAGKHNVVAKYSGDPKHDKSESQPVEQVVENVLTPTTTTVTSSENPSFFGQAVRFTATVTGDSPTGVVKFTRLVFPLTNCDAVPLVGNEATCTVNDLSVTTAEGHAIIAAYQGDPKNGKSSGLVTQKVDTGVDAAKTAINQYFAALSRGDQAGAAVAIAKYQSIFATLSQADKDTVNIHYTQVGIAAGTAAIDEYFRLLVNKATPLQKQNALTIYQLIFEALGGFINPPTADQQILNAHYSQVGIAAGKAAIDEYFRVLVNKATPIVIQDALNLYQSIHAVLGGFINPPTADQQILNAHYSQVGIAAGKAAIDEYFRVLVNKATPIVIQDALNLYQSIHAVLGGFINPPTADQQILNAHYSQVGIAAGMAAIDEYFRLIRSNATPIVIQEALNLYQSIHAVLGGFINPPTADQKILDDYFELIKNGGSGGNAGILGLWKFDEVPQDPTKAVDSKGNNSLSLSGGAGFTSPGYNNTSGGALQLNGTTAKAVSDKLQVRVPDPATGKITIATWFKQTSQGNQQVLLQGGYQATEDFYYRLEVSAMKNLRGGVGDGNTWDFNVITKEGSCPVSPNTWHLGVMTHDNATGITTVYLDDNPNPCIQERSTKNLVTTTGITVGAFTKSQDFNFAGLMDDVQVYNKVLTPEQVRQLYGPGVSKKFTSRVVIQPPTPNPSKLNQKVVFPTILESEDGTHMTGTVQFVDLSNGGNSVPQCAALTLQPFPDNPAGTFDFVRCETTGLSAGKHNVVARYSGDAKHDISESSPVEQVVENVSIKKQTTTSVGSVPNPSTEGQSVQFSASVTSASGSTPTGVFDFRDNTTGTPVLLCSGVPVTVGICNTSNLPPGDRKIEAIYKGDGDHLESTRILTQVVQPRMTQSQTQLSSSVGHSTVGQEVVFRAQVTGNGPTDHVKFFANKTLRSGGSVIAGCGSVPLINGISECKTKQLASGGYFISAGYIGDSKNTPSQSDGATILSVVEPRSIGRWQFDAADPTKDTGGNFPSSPVTLSPQGAQFASDSGKGVVNLNGQNGKLTANLPGPKFTMTIGAWFKQTVQDGHQQVILQGGTQPGQDFYYRLEVSGDNNLRGGVGNGTQWDWNLIQREGCAVTPNVWHKGVLIYTENSGAVELYLDDVLCYKATQNSAVRLASAPGITIGAFTSPGPYNFAGSIDEVRVVDFINPKLEPEITSLTSSLNPSAVAETIAITARVDFAEGGTVNFYNDQCAAVPVPEDGFASCKIKYNSAGNYSVNATYSGRPNGTFGLTQKVQ